MNEDTIIRPAPGQNGADAALYRIGVGAPPRHPQHSERAPAPMRPRDMKQFAADVLAYCARPGFAVLAEFARPIAGEVVTGPSIKFVDLALRMFRNVETWEAITYEDGHRRVTRVSVTDTENGITHSSEISVERVVERSDLRDGDVIVDRRPGSDGRAIYQVRAGNEEFSAVVGSARSKTRRELGLRLLPADVVAEAMVICYRTRSAKDAADLSAARLEIVEAFGQLGVMPAGLDAYLGHSIDQATSGEIEELRGACVSVRERQAQWSELVAARRAPRAEGTINAEGTSKLRAKLERAKARQAETPEPAA